MPGNLPLPSETEDPIRLADWLELLAIRSADHNSSHGDLQRGLNRLGMDGMEAIGTACMDEIWRRHNSAVDGYPFNFTGSLLSLKASWEEFLPYIFCLLLSYCSEKQKKVAGLKHEVMFELLACVVARRYLDGKALRFGFPRTELPCSFIKALSKVCCEVMEWSPFAAGRTGRQKDGGLDLLAWKPFPDGQLGMLILFGHCASGADWDGKINELQPHDFCSSWLGGERSPITKTFFIPHRLEKEEFNRRAVSAKLFFDRCRMALYADRSEFESATQDAIPWCREVMSRLAQ